MKELEKPGKADDSQAEESMTAAPEGEKAGSEETGMPSEAGEVRSDVGNTAPEDRKDEPSVETLRAEIEAILFSLGESVDIAVIADAVGLSRAETEKVLKDMQQRYEAADRGCRTGYPSDPARGSLSAQHEEGAVSDADQGCPAAAEDNADGCPDGDAVHRCVQATLTDVLMETLSIVAYRQPVTRTEIEKIRGVKCDHAINKLVEYNLIQEVGRLDAPGRPILFGTTEEFLRHFGTDSVDDLPAMNPVKVEDFKAEAEEEANVSDRPG